MANHGALRREFRNFVLVGCVVAATHYSVLIALVELLRMDPVPATLIGFSAGGLVSYLLNRRLTYVSDRPHREATWRFVIVTAIGFGLTWLLMLGFVKGLGVPYIPAQLLTTGIVLFWSFGANKFWTFRVPPVV